MPDHNTVASVHTHWHPNGSLTFSPGEHGDDGNQYKLEQLGYKLNYYLVNRKEEIRVRNNRGN